MAETGHDLAGLAFGLHVIAGSSRIADLLGHFHDVFGRAAMGGTRKRRDRGGNGSMQISFGSGHDPRGKGRGNLQGIKMIDPRSDARTQAYGVACASRRENMSPGMGIRLVAKPLYFAGMMVSQGE